MGDQTLPTGVKGKQVIFRYGWMSVKNVWKSFTCKYTDILALACSSRGVQFVELWLISLLSGTCTISS